MDNKRRSSRSRKKVKYAKLLESSDDDFEEKDTLVAKKQKGEKNDVSKSNKKKLERKEAKSAASDVPSRLSGSEKIVLHKDAKMAHQSYQEDRKPKNDFKHCANNEDYDRVEAIQEKGENCCNTELTDSKAKQKNKNQLDMEEDVEYTISSEEDKSIDNKDWKENSDEPDDGKSNSNKKSQVKMKEDGEYTNSEEEDKNADDKDWKENSDESDDEKSRLNKNPQAKMIKAKFNTNVRDLPQLSTSAISKQ